ncbi:hypothetical protein C8J57DRAFT_1235199 [Mycena rebaudengoi]|nr:hypothetical protein C8J57DRAFT_1235199 [Mycena rebaudengoi]
MQTRFTITVLLALLFSIPTFAAPDAESALESLIRRVPGTDVVDMNYGTTNSCVSVIEGGPPTVICDPSSGVKSIISEVESIEFPTAKPNGDKWQPSVNEITSILNAKPRREPTELKSFVEAP